MPHTTTVEIDGQTIDRVGRRIVLDRLTPYARGGIPSLSFARRGIALAGIPDPYGAKEVTLEIDGTLVFAGDVARYHDHYEPTLGWVREYECEGLLFRAQSIPVTDSLTLTDTCRFNLDANDPDKVGSRQGRTVAQVVLDVLEMEANSQALRAAGIGNYTGGG